MINARNIFQILSASKSIHSRWNGPKQSAFGSHSEGIQLRFHTLFSSIHSLTIWSSRFRWGEKLINSVVIADDLCVPIQGTDRRSLEAKKLNEDIPVECLRRCWQCCSVRRRKSVPFHTWCEWALILAWGESANNEGIVRQGGRGEKF